MKNDTDLQILVSLLSYLKKHDDVATRLGKVHGHAAGRKKHETSIDPTVLAQHKKLGSPGTDTFSPADIANAKRIIDERSRSGAARSTSGVIDTTSGNIPEVSETPSSEIPSSEIPSSERKYDDEGFHTGERKGKYFKPGEQEADGPEVTVVSPSDDPSDAPDYITDEENEILQWFQDENWSLPDIKQLLEDCTAPSTRVNKSFNKSNEYPLLKLFKRLRI